MSACLLNLQIWYLARGGLSEGLCVTIGFMSGSFSSHVKILMLMLQTSMECLLFTLQQGNSLRDAFKKTKV